MVVVWLGESGCGDPARAGGKAAGLSRLAAAHPVPPGFCLTVEAHARWGHTHPAAPALTNAGLAGVVAGAYAALGALCGRPELPVAVRSSAVEEDSPAASFAGQYTTVLNASGAAAITAAVVRCWESAARPWVRAYRQQRGLAAPAGPIAVLVQRLVLADVAGVCFTQHPVTGAEDAVLINAGWGLGPSVVGGTVTPDTYLVRKVDLAVVAHPADKRRMTICVPGGTQEVAVPRVLREQAVLQAGQARAVAVLALAVEADAGRPVDVEWAMQGEELFLLQCRPITGRRR